MWESILNALTRILTAFGAYFAGFSNGGLRQRTKQAEKALQDAQEALEAASRVGSMSDAEIMRRLRERGLLRDLPTDER